MADGAVGINSNIGRTAADVDDAYAQIFFVFSQNSLTARQRLKHDLIHLQTATMDTFLDVLQGGIGTGNDMYAGIESDAAHTDRFFDAGLVVDDVFLHHGMQDIVIRRDVDGFGGFDGAVDVGLRNFAVFDFDNPLRIQAADMVTRDTGRNVADFGVRHQFGFIDCLLNGLGRRVNVGYHACFKAARRCLSESDDVDFVVVLYFANQGDDFGCADIEGTDIFTLLFHYICSLFRWSYNYLSVLAIVCFTLFAWL